MPQHTKRLNLKYVKETPQQPGGKSFPTKNIWRHLGHLNMHGLFQSISRHFNFLNGIYKKETLQSFSYIFKI